MNSILLFYLDIDHKTNLLINKLKNANMKYTEIRDELTFKGFNIKKSELPIMIVDGRKMVFRDASNWISKNQRYDKNEKIIDTKNVLIDIFIDQYEVTDTPKHYPLVIECIDISGTCNTIYKYIDQFINISKSKYKSYNDQIAYSMDRIMDEYEDLIFNWKPYKWGEIEYEKELTRYNNRIYIDYIYPIHV